MDVVEPGEVFVNIPEFPGYFVSNFGRVWSDKMGGKMMKPWDRNGYLSVNLYKDGVVTTRKIHRLVARAFVPNPENKPCVDHIDRDRQNNVVTNLRYATKSENQWNRGSIAGSSSRYVGVFWEARRQKWKAQIQIDGKSKYLGYFTDEAAAARAYNAAAREHHGEFAKCNFE